MKTCNECGESFELPDFIISDMINAMVRTCPVCSDRHAEETGQRVIRESKLCREQTWRRICPPDFLDTERAKLPRPLKLDAVLAWEYGPTGLLLHSPTGAGKSRCAWMLFKREWMAGRRIKSLNASAGLTYAEKYHRGADEVGQWVDSLCHTDLLLMDDIFKSKLTDSFESAIFTIVTFRTENRLPIIFTTNDCGKSLTERMSQDRGEPLVRRIKEFCREISFA